VSSVGDNKQDGAQESQTLSEKIEASDVMKDTVQKDNSGQGETRENK
jgi:hypothetical protein